LQLGGPVRGEGWGSPSRCCEAHDIAVLSIITTHEMFALPYLWLRFDKLYDDVIHPHCQVDAVLHIHRHVHVRRGLVRCLRRFGREHLR
jgi:hypothetical protein